MKYYINLDKTILKAR